VLAAVDDGNAEVQVVDEKIKSAAIAIMHCLEFIFLVDLILRSVLMGDFPRVK
jgi:hypothetical protein